MKLLFLTNFYPPASFGGYEQWCQEVADGLTQRGHQVHILTSRYLGPANFVDPPWVDRSLHLEMALTALRNALDFFWSRTERERENCATLRQTVTDFDPDVIVIWGMWNLSNHLAAEAETLRPGRVVFYMGDYWPTLPSQIETYWDAPARSWATALPKQALKLAARPLLAREKTAKIAFDHVLFPSLFLRDELARRGFKPGRAKIIYGAIDTGRYRRRPDGPTDSGLFSQEITLLYVGRLTADKGVHTAIEAVEELVHRRNHREIKLLIIGDGPEDYVSGLKEQVRTAGVTGQVTFVGERPTDLLPGFYQKADIVLFTSIWPEPFGRVVVEGMAAGTVVIGSRTGGAVEILRDEENGLSFPAGDGQALADQIEKIINFPSLKKNLETAARQTARVQFDILRMAVEIETYCHGLAAGSAPSPAKREETIRRPAGNMPLS